MSKIATTQEKLTKILSKGGKLTLQSIPLVGLVFAAFAVPTVVFLTTIIHTTLIVVIHQQEKIIYERT